MKRVLLILALFLAGFNLTYAQSTLSAGDVVIVGVASDDPDEFGLLLLADVLSGTEIMFTDMGWINTTSTFRRTEDSMTWKANTNLPAGTLIIFNNDVTGTTASNYGNVIQGKINGLAAAGDQILVFQGTMANPNFLFAINFDGLGWVPDASSSNNSALPPGLVNGLTAVTVNEIDNMIYQGDSIGSAVFLRGRVCDSSNWVKDDNNRLVNMDPSTNGRQGFLTVGATPAIRNYATSFNGDFGQVQVNAQSSASSFFVGGTGLIADIVVSVNAPFEVSINGGSYSTTGSITPSTGTVSPTLVSIRMSPTAGGSFADTVQITSTGAFTNQLLVMGQAIANPVVSFLSGTGNYNEGAVDSIGVYIQNKGANTVVVGLTSKVGQTAIEGIQFVFPNGPQVVFDANSADTLYIQVTVPNDNVAGPQYRRNRLGFMLTGGDPGTADSFNVVIAENDYKYSKIAGVKQLDANFIPISNDSLFEVTGVVYGTNTRASGNGYSFTIIDETGGISNFAPSTAPTFGYTITEGDSILMRGRLTHFNGLIQLDFLDTIRVLKTGATLKMPIVMNKLDESAENDLVRINNVAFVTPTPTWSVSGSGTNYRVYNTVTLDTFEIRVLPVSNLANTPAPSGLFDVIGLGGQFDNSNPRNSGYQLFPRYAADVIIDELDAFSLVSPANNTTITLQGAPTQTVTFDWEVCAPLNGGQAPTYTFYLDLTTGDFTSPLESASTNTDTSVTYTYKELIDLAGSNLPNGGSLTVQWTASASNNNQIEWAGSVNLLNLERGVIDGLLTATPIARIYPNPASQTLHVEMVEKADKMQLFDMTGKEVLEISTPNATQEISVDGLNNGVYLLIISQNGKQFQSRVVVSNR